MFNKSYKVVRYLCISQKINGMWIVLSLFELAVQHTVSSLVSCSAMRFSFIAKKLPQVFTSLSLLWQPINRPLLQSLGYDKSGLVATIRCRQGDCSSGWDHGSLMSCLFLKPDSTWYNGYLLVIKGLKAEILVKYKGYHNSENLRGIRIFDDRQPVSIL